MSMNQMKKPKQFDMLYQCSIDTFKQIIPKPLDPWRYSDLTSTTPVTQEQEVVEFVNIKMTMEEYERFNRNWEQYLTLMHVAHNDPRIKNEYHKLLMMVNLLA